MIKTTRAFTLVEILTIFAVIGGLIIFSVVSGPTQLQKARDAKRKADLNIIRKSVEETYEATSCYPVSLPVCGIDNLPCDPKTEKSYVYVSANETCPSWFQLYGNLEYLRDKIIDKVGCRDGCGPGCQFNYGVSSSNQKLNSYCGFSSDEDSENESLPSQYVCAPGGECEVFTDPAVSGCPDIYPDDPTCRNQCANKDNRCHDSRGKTS